MPSFLVVGGSRGIGLALVEELLKDPDNFVITTARDLSQSPGLRALTSKYPKDRLVVLVLDLAHRETVERAGEEATTLLPNGLDCLIHNSAINLRPVGPFEEMDLDQLEEELRINTIAPIHALRTFLPLIRKSKAQDRKIIFMSSGLASIENGFFWAGLSEGYSVSKAGLNMVVRKWGAALKQEGIATFALQPGYVDTDMGQGLSSWIQEHAAWVPMMSPNDCAAQCLKVVREVKLEDAVAFYSFEGKREPW
ncbi:uncharacterized protein C8Q71DRAFT_303999 [Rhodofomes roseus]|uniref:NAD(P)-binding protein n=1 Tax=Rhodofomes roseus TaxID=34475 RepID=A0A4Y9YK13_9APHY|nr:uncharacterized protein C8Q71DRAFT_303999 [Rhodofomes roseus]KAH9831448.1 hypothetical protein C8Q71DRAFT_303999 [Rhodofomes roseus]TFY62725.1 hypothetical protein EVJ58_g3679 [Rhodofomes roseus]